jgi:urea transport system substrate-binding protein
MSRRVLGVGISLIVAAVLGTGWLAVRRHSLRVALPPITVGVLHSLTGTMAISERSVVDATLLAIEEINEAGGLLGREVRAVVMDGKSDSASFALAAEHLISETRASVVFGCWTSASRKTVRPIFERHDHLLFYPVQYEGLEASANIIYTGAAPNQQILPAVRWAFDNLGKRFFLVGSDYVFPRTANAIIKDQLTALGGEIVGEEYILLGSQDVADAVAKIVAAEPDVILNTINGDSNIPFFRALRMAGISPEQIPTMSFSIGEAELGKFEDNSMQGDYACWSYFQGVDTPENRKFVKRFKRRYGRNRVTSDPLEAAYFGVNLWAQAVRSAGSPDAGQVRRALAGQSFDAPEGLVHIDGNNNHCWKFVRIGRVGAQGQFDEVWSSGRPVRPIPYPAYRSRVEWDHFLDSLYTGWGQHWENVAF